MCSIFQEKPAAGAKQMAARNLSRALVSAQDEPCVVHPEQKILHMPAEALWPAEKAQDLPPRQPSRPSDVRLGEHPSVCHLPAGAAGDRSTEKSISVGMWGQGFRGLAPTPWHRSAGQRGARRRLSRGDATASSTWQGPLENHPSPLRNQSGENKAQDKFLNQFTTKSKQ